MTPYYQDDLVTIYHGDWRGDCGGKYETRIDGVLVEPES